MYRLMIFVLILSGCGKSYQYLAPLENHNFGKNPHATKQSIPFTKKNTHHTKFELNLLWPINGTLVINPKRQNFDKGIELRPKQTDSVVAVADGIVLFSGHGGRTVGNIIVIKHAHEVLSLYTQQRQNLVSEGQTVKAGQQIAQLGHSESGYGILRFELRVHALPVDPLKFLPKKGAALVDN